jgi:four helix bundle protein
LQSKIQSKNEYKTDLIGRCYKFSLNVIKLTDSLPQKKSAWIISDQLIRCGTSIGANLIEGKASSSRREFKRYYEIALKSANEAKYWLNLLKDTKIADTEKVDELINEVTEIANMLAKGVINLKK